MGWLDAFRLRSAALAYARKLPRHLARSYGRGRAYTTGQIETAVKALKLNPLFIALALAAYLDEADYAALADRLPLTLDYDEARARFRRSLPSGSPSSASSAGDDNSWGPYSDGGSGDHGGHGGGHH